MEYKIAASVCCNKGRIRRNNEDNFYINGYYLSLEKMDEGAKYCCESSQPFQVYAVCDGMGGCEAGEVASEAVASSLAELSAALRSGCAIRDCIDRAFQNANDSVCGLKMDAGSTLTLLCIADDIATLAWLGDSRAYLYRNGTLSRINEDHTQAQRLVNIGVMDPKTAEHHPTHHVLTRYIGINSEEFLITPTYWDDTPIESNDVFLLCSDGLSDMLNESEIAQLFGECSENIAELLVDAAIKAGGRDNVTALIVKVISD